MDGDDLVAIKNITKTFEHKTYAYRALREIKIMRLLDHENILQIRTIF